MSGVLLCVVCGACGTNNDDDNGAPPPVTESHTTAPTSLVPSSPLPADEEVVCSLADTTAAGEFLLTISPLEVASTQPLRVWVSGADESKALEINVNVMTVEVTKLEAERTPHNWQGDQPVVAGQELLAYGGAQYGVDLAGVGTPGRPIRVTGTSINSSAGPAFMVTAVIEDDGLIAGSCSEQLNREIGEVAQVLGEPADALLPRLVEDRFADEALVGALNEAETPIEPSLDELIRQYEAEWSATPVAERQLDVGFVPPSLADEVHVTGVWVEGTVSDGDPVTLMLVTDLGASYAVQLPGGAGAAAAVLPVSGDVRVVTLDADGRASAPVATFEASATTVRIEYAHGTAQVDRIRDEQLADLMGVEPDAIDELRSEFEANLVYDPSVQADPPVVTTGST